MEGSVLKSLSSGIMETVYCFVEVFFVSAKILYHSSRIIRYKIRQITKVNQSNSILALSLLNFSEVFIFSFTAFSKFYDITCCWTSPVYVYLDSLNMAGIQILVSRFEYYFKHRYIGIR